MRRRGFIHGATLAAAAVALPGCSPAQLGLAPPSHVERKDSGGDVELILNVVDVWDSQGAGAPEELTVDGEEMYFRPRPSSFMEQAWMRAGLFWHSRQDKVILTTVVLGPTVEIKKMQMSVGDSFATALPAKNFQFTPAQRVYDQDLSAQAFSIKPALLDAVIDAEAASIALTTGRGQLRGDLLSVPDTTPESLRRSAKFLFSEFAEQRRLIVAARG